jgi:hypothetical protein
VLYTGSSVFIARSEVEVPFVRRWLEGLRRSSDPTLRDAAVLVRPHPFNADSWVNADFSDLGSVVVWPRHRYTPAEESARTSFFDSLYYSAAIVGINTSAMIEGAILQRPVLSLLTPEFAGTQEGTLHFHYLLPENGGFLRVAHTLEEHEAQLIEVLQHPELVREQTTRFVAAFLRPHGLDVACTPLLAGAIERAARDATVGPRRESLGTKVCRAWALPVAVLVKSFGEGGPLQITRPPSKKKASKKKPSKTMEAKRAARVTAKEIARRQARLASKTDKLARSMVRRTAKTAGGMNRAALAALRWPVVRARRLLRLARYGVATRILGRR